MLNRKFSAPKATDLRQWRKVALLVEHGFVFHSVYRSTPDGRHTRAAYPKNLAEVPAFAAEFASQAIAKPLGAAVAGTSKLVRWQMPGVA